jgi:hypothetical protein
MMWFWCFLGLLVTAVGAPAELALPFAELPAAEQALVRGVTERVTLQRVYKPTEFTGQMAHFDFLMRDMVACSALARQLGLIQYQAEVDEAGRVWADNREGSRGYMQRLWAQEGRYLYYVAGSERGLFEAHGRGVAFIESRTVGPQRLEYKADLFVRVDNAVLAALAKLFQIFLGGSVDRNFAHVMRHPVTITELATADPARVRAAIARLPPERRVLFREMERTLASD